MLFPPSHGMHGFPGAAALLELLSEPLYILAQSRLLFKLRVAVETSAIVSKALLTLSLLHRTGIQPAIALSWAQVSTHLP